MAVNPVEALINKIYKEAQGSKYWDSRLGGAVESARLSLSDINRMYNSGVNEANIGYDETSRDLLKNRDDTYRHNTNQFGSQGIIKSGIFAGEQGKVGEQYQKGLTQAAQRRTSAKANLADQRLAGYNEIQRVLRGEQSGAVERAALKRQQEAQRRLEAHYRKEQQRMAAEALRIQKQQIAQQKALMSRSGGGGGGGGGGGAMYDLASLFPGMFAPPRYSPPLKSYGVKAAKKVGKPSQTRKVRVM